MSTMKKFTSVLLSLLALASYGQTLDDIELFNISNLHGTPRFVGMGGAFTALGNDFSAIHLNPASAAVFRSDQFGLTAGYIHKSGEHRDWFGASDESTWNTFSFENLGLIKRFELGGYDSDSYLTLGLSYNKMADFDREYTVYGNNMIDSFAVGTLADYWLYEEPYAIGLNGALGKSINDISNEAYAAYQAGVLLAGQGDTIRDFAFGYGPNQNNISYFRSERGALEESAITLAGQFTEELYVGLSLAFPTFRYNSTDRLRESGLPVDSAPFDATSYSLLRYNTMQATGFNLKVGLIYRPTQWFRAGASYQSPSWYTVDQIYDFEVTSSFANGDALSSDLLSTNDYSYRIATPSIFRLGTAVIFGKQGLVSVDYQFSNSTNNRAYTSGSSYNISDEFLDESNEAVDNFFSNRSTIRLGGEYRVTPELSARAGYMFDQSFYSNPEDTRSNTESISFGLGYNNANFGFELAYVNQNYDRQDYVHPFPMQEENRTVTSNMRSHRVVAGFNVKF